MSVSQLTAAALAASLAVPALASGAKDEIRSRMERARQAQQQQEQQKQRPPQAEPEKGTPSPLSGEQREAIGAVLARNQLAVRAGQLATLRGGSPETKNLGRWLAADHQRVGQDLTKLLGPRGADPSTLPSASEKQRLESELGTLAKAQGEEFDRAFVEFLTRNKPSFVDALKRARDVTPGSDAELKRYLDQAEDLEEGHLSAARQLSQDRQGRTPARAARPARPR